MTLGLWLKAPKPQFLHLLNWNTNTHKGFWRFLGAYWVSISPISIWGSSFPTLYPSGLAGVSTTSLQECRTQSRRLCEAPGHETCSGMSTWPHLIRVPLSTQEEALDFPLRIDTRRPSGWGSSSHLPPRTTWEQRQQAKKGGASPGDRGRQGSDNIVRIQFCLKSALCLSPESVNALCTYTWLVQVNQEALTWYDLNLRRK